MNVSKAKALLAEAEDEQGRTRRHLLVAAALREVLAREPVVVGGTAQDLYTGDVYRETDLDLVGWLTREEELLLIAHLGFVREGRHLSHLASKVAVEFPESKLAGDEARIRHLEVQPGSSVAIISIEDLYLDRVRQATATPTPSPSDVNVNAALAIALASFEDVDWDYVSQHIRETEKGNPSLGKRMRKIHNRIRRKALAKL